MISLTRRTLLRGAAASIALPWLDVMANASSLLASGGPANGGISGGGLARGAAEPVRRIAFMYIPNGVIAEHWLPADRSADFLSPASLRPLESVRDEIVVINGLNRTYLAGEPHSQAGSCWMTSSRPDAATDGVAAINTTLDQIIARETGRATPFPSLELSCNSFVDNMEPRMFDAISWYGPDHDAKSINDPVRLFERLFGKTDNVNRSVLDTVMEDARDLRAQLGVADRRKLDEYMESVRAIESRLDKQAGSRHRNANVVSPLPDEPPVNRGDYIRLMGDLMVLALRTDQTRVASLMVGPERWETPQLYDSVFDKPVNHHQMTHDDAYDEQVALIDRFHVEQFTYLVKKMRETPDGDASLLDNTLFVLGSGISDGNSHSYRELPMVIAGRGAGRFRTGRRIDCAKGTPLANLWLTLGQEMGVAISSFADSDGPLAEFAG